MMAEMNTLAKVELSRLFTPEPGRQIDTCDICGEPIYAGGHYYNGFAVVCQDCMQSMTAEDFIREVLEEQLIIAEGR